MTEKDRSAKRNQRTRTALPTGTAGHAGSVRTGRRSWPQKLRAGVGRCCAPSVAPPGPGVEKGQLFLRPAFWKEQVCLLHGASFPEPTVRDMHKHRRGPDGGWTSTCSEGLSWHCGMLLWAWILIHILQCTPSLSKLQTNVHGTWEHVEFVGNRSEHTY